MKNFCLSKDYDKNVFPRDNSTAEPIDIKLEFNDLEVLHVNDKDFTVTLKMYLGAHWNEPRIISLGSEKNKQTPLDLKFLEHEDDLGKILMWGLKKVQSFLKFHRIFPNCEKILKLKSFGVSVSDLVC